MATACTAYIGSVYSMLHLQQALSQQGTPTPAAPIVSPAAGTTADPAARSGSGGVARRAADAITNLAHENLEIKNMVRREGGIAPLVRLLSSWDMKVQRAGAGALRTLAFKNDDNKRQIVEAGALPLLIQVSWGVDRVPRCCNVACL
eukprot:GHUV01054020.1.p1 GENE.GHUV01054020.1~~GHUV01054020.1.p1  ORF type:complete len:147 (-),score=45.25 GHUV01054020.1:7-447(-)